MKNPTICLIVVSVLFSSLVILGETPRCQPPTAEELRELHLPESTLVTVCAFGNSGRYQFVIFACDYNSQVCYLFRSAEIKDFVCSMNRRMNGAPEAIPRVEVLKFFATRFRGIANDLSHQKWRPDVTVEPLGSLKPLGDDDVKTLVLFSLIYDGYSSAIEDVLKSESK